MVCLYHVIKAITEKKTRGGIVQPPYRIGMKYIKKMEKIKYSRWASAIMCSNIIMSDMSCGG